MSKVGEHQLLGIGWLIVSVVSTNEILSFLAAIASFMELALSAAHGVRGLFVKDDR